MEDPLFVQQPYKVGAEQVHDSHDSHMHTGDQIDLVDHEEDQDIDQHKADFEPERRDKLLRRRSSDDVLIAVIEQYHQKLAHCKQNSLIPVDISGVWILHADPEPVAQDKTDLQHHNIQDDKVEVFEPASHFFFMHKTLLAVILPLQRQSILSACQLNPKMPLAIL